MLILILILLLCVFAVFGYAQSQKDLETHSSEDLITALQLLSEYKGEQAGKSGGKFQLLFASLIMGGIGTYCVFFLGNADIVTIPMFGAGLVGLIIGIFS